MVHRSWVWLCSMVSMAVVAMASPAWAAVRLCLEVQAEDADKVGLAKLAASEIARHASHQLVERNCDTSLRVESFRVGNQRYLTLQIQGEIPVRNEVADDRALGQKLAEATTLVLGNDPLFLSQDPSRWSRLEQAKHSVLVRGINTYRVEIFQTLTRTDQGATFAPGAAFALWRGADEWQIFGRFHFAGRPDPVAGEQRVLRLRTGAEAGLIYETSRRAATAAYFGAAAGLTFLRFEGRLEGDDPGSLDSVNRFGGSLHLRTGIRTLRLYDFDADVFLGAELPLFATRQTDSLLFGENGIYTPFLELGVGVGF